MRYSMFQKFALVTIRVGLSGHLELPYPHKKITRTDIKLKTTKVNVKQRENSDKK